MEQPTERHLNLTASFGNEDIDLARSLIGPDAGATGRLRIACAGSLSMLQQEWHGTFGAIWLAVPTYTVPGVPSPHRAGRA